MTFAHGDLLIYALLLVLPISALIARRVPLLRILTMLVSWAGLMALLLVIIAQRGRFDPYMARIASALKLNDQQVVGREVRIAMDADGHFWAKVSIAGVERRMLIDSGATITAVSTETAAAAGLKVDKPIFPLLIQTANGQISADTSTVPELRLGNVAARDLPVLVSPAFGDTDVLGMNFLSRLKSWRVEGRTLVLTPHHPQSFT
ncbi:TIGR02281 family clan AA aspartic protease [uncultured Sphingomonas sp.]|uniref:retropepsin-like aspartic protease family protein n=1 Tax=uncultured Sphingomonas sp. TaxID=158754 RepID=UPI0035CB53CE